MVNLRPLIIVATLVTTSPAASAQPRRTSSETVTATQRAANDWIANTVQSLDYQDIQLLANTLYLTYAESLLTVSVQRHKRSLLLAMWRTYKADDTPSTISDIMQQLQKLQELTATQRFIRAAWQSCVTYIDQDDFEYHHPACNHAIAAFVSNTKDTALAYLNDSLVELEDGLPYATNIIEQADTMTRQIRNLARLIHNTTEPLEKFDHILSLSPAVQEPAADLVQMGMLIDEYLYRMLDAIQLSAITYYKQLYTWMQQQQVPAHYQTYLFDSNGIIPVSARTEPLQDPTNLAYTS